MGGWVCKFWAAAGNADAPTGNDADSSRGSRTSGAILPVLSCGRVKGKGDYLGVYRWDFARGWVFHWRVGVATCFTFYGTYRDGS